MSDVACERMGEQQGNWHGSKSMAPEDFDGMLEACHGAYVWLGGDGATLSAALNNAKYDYKDALLQIGIRFWQQLVESVLIKR